jgi:hypothetical protein
MQKISRQRLSLPSKTTCAMARTQNIVDESDTSRISFTKSKSNRNYPRRKNKQLRIRLLPLPKLIRIAVNCFFPNDDGNERRGWIPVHPMTASEYVMEREAGEVTEWAWAIWKAQDRADV